MVIRKFSQKKVFPHASKLVHETNMQIENKPLRQFETKLTKTRFKVRPAWTEYPTENYTMFNQISDVKCNLKIKLFKLTGS